jgi:RHS repeat-associated protein
LNLPSLRSGKLPPAITFIRHTYASTLLRAGDSLYRLTGAQYSTGESFAYTYDAVGNRLSLTTGEGVVNYEYDAANRLTSVNGQAYAWDANGNLLDDGLRSYTYDHADRLTQVANGALTTEFAYNGAGDRVAKTVDGVTTDYVLDPAAGLTQVLQDTTDGQTQSYLYGHDLLAQHDSGTWAYHVNDGLGSVRHLVDSTGQVVGSYSFSPFGVPLGESGGEPYGFTGERWDVDAALLYLRARCYEPEMGRFTTEDPAPGYDRIPRSLHLYVYAWNNPLNLADPAGLQVPPPTDCEPGDICYTGTFGPYNVQWAWPSGGQYIYTRDYGFFDTSHMGAGDPGFALEQAKEAVRLGEPGPVYFYQTVSPPVSAVRGHFRGVYEIRGDLVEPEQVEGVMLAMYEHWSKRFEYFEGSIPIFGRGTSFAVEDLPSHHLGFYEATGMSREEIFKRPGRG